MKTIVKLAQTKFHNNNSYNAVQVEVDYDRDKREYSCEFRATFFKNGTSNFPIHDGYVQTKTLETVGRGTKQKHDFLVYFVHEQISGKTGTMYDFLIAFARQHNLELTDDIMTV